jgi:hypothetical protein
VRPYTFHSQRGRLGRVRSRTPSLSNRQVGRYTSHPAPHWVMHLPSKDSLARTHRHGLVAFMLYVTCASE